MKRSLALPVAAVVAAGGFAAIPAAVPALNPPAQAATEDAKNFDDEVAQQMLVQVNEHRESKGLKPLTSSLALDGIAQPWAKSMAADQKLSHNPDSSTKTFATGATGTAENVAQNNPGEDAAATARALVDSLLESPGHRKNIEGAYNAVGLGFAVAANGQTYAVQNFAHYEGTIPQPASEAPAGSDGESDDDRGDGEKSGKDGKDKSGKHESGKHKSDEDGSKSDGHSSDRSEKSKAPHGSSDSDSTEDDADAGERGLVLDPEQLTAEEFVAKDDAVVIKASGLKAGSKATMFVKKDDGSLEHSETRKVDAKGTVTFSVHGEPTDDISGYEGSYSVTVKSKGSDSLKAGFTVGADAAGDADKGDKDDAKSDKDGAKGDEDDAKSEKKDGAKAGSGAASVAQAAGDAGSADDASADKADGDKASDDAAAGTDDASDDDGQAGGNDAQAGGDDAAEADDEAAGNPGTLPRTGPELAGAGLGAALLAIGGATVMLTRRRLG
ncbi:hypothetical protein GCM10022261_08480 [Brevibacterium daeguense]|uniref:SCP domain-containing protein n=1 Tax=Brevibacterium daeguense TaxID=909936 RepID=A0ABP8EHB1_9MICO|nr:CAP domain-containing protein [Brevibacterium daeguense]